MARCPESTSRPSPATLTAEHLSALNAIRCRRGRALLREHRRRIIRIGQHDYRVPSQHDGGLYAALMLKVKSVTTSARTESTRREEAA